jgi:N-acetylneuraminate synthase
LDALVRGAYARKDLEAGYVLSAESFAKDFYLAIPLLKGQLSVREILNGLSLSQNVQVDAPLMVEAIDGPYSRNPVLRSEIASRGL